MEKYERFWLVLVLMFVVFNQMLLWAEMKNQIMGWFCWIAFMILLVFNVVDTIKIYRDKKTF